MGTFKLLQVIIFVSFAFLQGQTSGDSLQSRAKSIVYERPDETISIALKILKKEKETDKIADLYMLISSAYIVKKYTDSSLIYILKAENLIPKTSLATTKIKMLNLIAVQYQQMELYEKALEFLDKAEKMSGKLPEKSKEYFYNSGFINNMRGIIYTNQSNPDLALKKFKLAAYNFQKLKTDENSAANLSIINYNMGNCYLDLSQPQKAFSHFLEAEKYAEFYRDIILKAYALKGQGEYHFITHHNEESIKILQQAEKMSASIGDLVLNEVIYSLLAKNYLAIKNTQQFQNYNAKSLEILKTLEEDELKSLDRYIDTQNNKSFLKINNLNADYNLYNLISAVLFLGIVTFLLSKIYKHYRRNLLLKKVMERLLKTGNIYGKKHNQKK